MFRCFVPFPGLKFRLDQRYRMTYEKTRSHCAFYFISHYDLSRDSGNSLDQIQISRESRVPGLKPNDDPPVLKRLFYTTRPH